MPNSAETKNQSTNKYKKEPFPALARSRPTQRRMYILFCRFYKTKTSSFVLWHCLYQKHTLKSVIFIYSILRTTTFCTSAISSMGWGSIGMTSPLFIEFGFSQCSAKRERKVYVSPSSTCGERAQGETSVIGSNQGLSPPIESIVQSKTFLIQQARELEGERAKFESWPETTSARRKTVAFLVRQCLCWTKKPLKLQLPGWQSGKKSQKSCFVSVYTSQRHRRVSHSRFCVVETLAYVSRCLFSMLLGCSVDINWQSSLGSP